MTLGRLLGEAGWLMAPLYACSLAVVALVVHKLLELRGARIKEMAWLSPTLEAVGRGDLPAAHKHCGEAVHPAARAVHAFLDTLGRRPDRAEAEAARVGSAELQRLERHLGLLSFVAQAAPLLGLLGTVVGMVELFMAIQGAGSGDIDLNVLSAGIWTALLTTAAGLVVAVPALGAYTWLTGRVDRVRLQIADVVGRVLSAMPEAIPESNAPETEKQGSVVDVTKRRAARAL
jgi:biopolymer transport protein ExbB